MRGLMAAVIGMGILIAVGTTVLVVLLVQRMSAAPAPNASAAIAGAATPVVGGGEAVAILDEPAGTHIAGTSLAGERLAVQLAGGGPDRVIVVDLRTSRIVARASMAR